MKITKILSYLVYPGKHLDEQQNIGGAIISKKGSLYKMLSELFLRSDRDCNIPICFLPSSEGVQENECRSEIIELLNTNTSKSGLKLAYRLQATTTGKSGLGLLFLIISESDQEKRLLISRFPADQGIIAEQRASTLKVEFIEQVFLKSAHSYKAVLYKGTSFDSDFWVGNAVDKQLNHATREVATYWIKDFLLSDFQTTPRAGTKRLALALKNAGKKTNSMLVKEEIAAVAALARNMDGKNTTIQGFCEHFNLSLEAKKMIYENLKSERLLQDLFQFDITEFVSHLSYKTIELDNGAILTATTENFEKCFQKKVAINKEYIFETQGSIVDERFKRTK